MAHVLYYVGDGALLELALVDFALRTAMKHGCIPVTVPHLVNANAMRAMGYLEHGGHDEIYYFPKDNLYLIGTAGKQLAPCTRTRFSTAAHCRYATLACRRATAASRVATAKTPKELFACTNLRRSEMLTFCDNTQSANEHARMLAIEEELMQSAVCHITCSTLSQVTSGFPRQKWDIGAWFPAQNRYRETHSTSNCTDFQARRLNTRIRTTEGVEVAHMVNGTAFSGRPIAAILENFQQADGSVRIPEVLRHIWGKR